LRANALLAFDGSLGHVTEVLSGSDYQSLSTSSPHQIWSAATVVSPLLRGLLGLETDAIHRRLTSAPHAPSDWTRFSLENVRVGNNTLLLNYKKVEAGISLEVGLTSGSEECTSEFCPAVSLQAKVQKADLNGKPVPFRVEANANDQHVVVSFPVRQGKNVLRIYLQNDFGLSVPSSLPPLGSTNRGLRILSETWSPSKDQLALEVSGTAGSEYELKLWNPGQIENLEGADLGRTPEGQTLLIRIPRSDSEPYPHMKVVSHFWAKVSGD
jgi:hypothetical protein